MYAALYTVKQTNHTRLLQAPELMEDLLGVYEKKRIAPPPKEDKFGRTVVVEIRFAPFSNWDTNSPE